MTISEVLQRTSKELIAITDEEWEKELSHYFDVTRPEYARKIPGNTITQTYISPEKRVAFNNVKEKTGIDLAQMMRDLNVGKRKKK
jgi:hypothetical protein